MSAAFLPAPTNGSYKGARSAVWFLGFSGVASLFTGLVHFGLPDGGAGVIAGLDLSLNGTTVIAAFAWFGALQIAHAIGVIVVAVRYQSLTPLFLLLTIIERGLMSLDAWFLKGSGGRHPPEHYINPLVCIIALAFLVLSLRIDTPAGERHTS